MQTTNQIATVGKHSTARKFNVMGHAVTELVTRKETTGNYYVFEVVTPPGHGIPPHVHEREDELIYVAEGEYEVMLGDKLFRATAGDEIFFPRHIPHAFQNIGSKAGRTLWTVVPGGNFEEFFIKLGALPPGEPDMKQVVAIFAEYGMKVLVGEPA